MFDEISPTYDFLNHFFSMGNDLRWRKKAVKLLKAYKFNNILDLAAGSGDLGRELLKLKPEKLFSVDLSLKMLHRNHNKMKSSKNHIIATDAEYLPFKDCSIDLTGIAFGIRNFDNLDRCLKEIHRILTEKGLFLVIEMFRPEKKNILHKTFNFYFTKLVPFIGNIISKSKYAYNYLNYSVYGFNNINEFTLLLEENGFETIIIRNLFLNFVYMVLARKKS